MIGGASGLRLRGFLRKEFLQIRRDPSSIILAIVMPLVMLFLFGYGVSLDPRHVPVALVVERPGPASRTLAARFDGSPFFRPRHAATMREAETWLADGTVDGIVRVRAAFEERAALGPADGRPPVQLVLNAVDANRARLVLGYVRGAIGAAVAVEVARGARAPAPGVTIESRVWFNESVDSRAFLVPGLLALVMTLIGVLLTALVIAREWERGTMEALLATPLRVREFLLGKLLPYFALGMIGMLLSVGLGVAVFHVPFRGSFAALLVTSGLFLLASLGLGLFLSAALRLQFVAAQVSLVAGFLPAFFLSGLLFDLASTPPAIRAISHVVPARWFVSISRTLFLAGDVPAVLVPGSLVLAAMAVLGLAAARSRLGLRLERGR